MDDGELWSWVRKVMSQGADIQADYANGKFNGYESYSAHMDHRALERCEEFAAAHIAELTGPLAELTRLRAEVERLLAANKANLLLASDQENVIDRLRAMLDAAPAEPQQAEPVSAFQRSAPERIWLSVGDVEQGQVFDDVADGGDEWAPWILQRDHREDVPYVRADLVHPPAAEVQRLREALKPFAAIDLTTNQAVDAMDVLRARRALEGK